MERYILGSEVLTISDQEPTAGQVEVEPRLLGGFLSAGWWPTELRRLPVPLGVRGLAHELSRAGAADLGQALPPAREGVGAMKHAFFGWCSCLFIRFLRRFTFLLLISLAILAREAVSIASRRSPWLLYCSGKRHAAARSASCERCALWGLKVMARGRSHGGDLRLLDAPGGRPWEPFLGIPKPL